MNSLSSRGFQADRSDRAADTDGSHQSQGSTGGVVVTEVTAVSREIVEAFARLVPQLSSSSPAPSRAELEEIASSWSSVLLIASDPDAVIIGSLTLVLFRVPTGVRAWIEDVVVDESARGAGAGEALVVAALDRSQAEGAKSVDLTSRPSREAANRLYVKLGFEARQTNVYRYNSKP